MAQASDFDQPELVNVPFAFAVGSKEYTLH